MMNHIFQEEIREGWLVVYMDDLLIATKDDPAFHEQSVQRILQHQEKGKMLILLNAS
jgi:hypothetical protein